MTVSVRFETGSRAGRASLRMAAAATLAVALAGCTTSGEDYFDDGSAAAAMEQENQPLFHRLLSGSIIDPPRTQIEYTARSPLVIPPTTTELPPPEAAGSSAKSAVAWPKDPDVTEAERDAARRAAVNPADVSKDALRPGERMTPEEIQAGRIAGGGLASSTNYSTVNSKSHNRMADRLTPEQLAQKPAMPSNNRAEISATPTRKYLIEPPSTYRTPATTAEMPEVKATAGVGGDTYYDPKKSKLDNLVGN